MGKTLSLKGAALVIFLSLFLITGPIALTFLYAQSRRAKQLKDESFIITDLKTHTTKREVLPDDYFAEWLNLSKDKPTNLAAFSLSEAEARLRKSPVVEWVKLKREGHTLLIDYKTPNPLFHLIDYENTLMSSEGVIFPREPFFLDKRLPELYLGLKPYGEEVKWGEAIQEMEKLDLAFDVMKGVSREIHEGSTRLVRVDVSKAFAKSLGQREVVVTLEERFSGSVNIVFLRLNSDEIKEGISRYRLLKKVLADRKREIIVDLRVDKMGFISGTDT